MAKIKRYQRLHYMDTSATSTPTYSLINVGVVKFDDALNPKTETSQGIADETEQDEVVGYKPVYSYEANADDTDPVSVLLYETGANQVIGKTVDVITVDAWTQTTGETPVCDARKATYNVIPEQAGSGAPGGNLKMTGRLSQASAITDGTFSLTSKTFTAAT